MATFPPSLPIPSFLSFSFFSPCKKISPRSRGRNSKRRWSRRGGARRLRSAPFLSPPPRLPPPNAPRCDLSPNFHRFFFFLIFCLGFHLIRRFCRISAGIRGIHPGGGDREGASARHEGGGGAGRRGQPGPV